MELSWFSRVLHRAVKDGLRAVALVDRRGRTIALAGAITRESAGPLAALVMYRCKSDDLKERLFAGEVLSVAVDGGDAALCVAKRQLFVVAVVDAATPAVLERVGEVRGLIASMLAEQRDDDVPWTTGGDGEGGAGPAELSLVELGSPCVASARRRSRQRSFRFFIRPSSMRPSPYA